MYLITENVNVQYRSDIAAECLLSGQISKAEKLIQALLDSSPLPEDEPIANLFAIACRIAPINIAIQVGFVLVESRPRDVDAVLELSNLLQQENRLGEARKLASTAIMRLPKDPRLLFCMALIHQNRREWIEAEHIYLALLRSNPDLSPVVLFNLANLETDRHRLACAVGYYDRFLHICPDDIEALSAKCAAEIDLGYLDSASKTLRVLIRLPGISSDLFFLKARLLHRKGDLAGALEAYEKFLGLDKPAIQINSSARFPDAVRQSRHFSDALCNVGKIVFELATGSPQFWYEAALEANPDNNYAKINQSVAYLRASQFQLGWAGWRYRTCVWENTTHAASEVRKLEDYAGRDVHIVFEQGVGDQIFQARVLRHLFGLARNVAVTCDTRLIPLLRANFPKLEIFDEPSRKLENRLEVFSGDIFADFYPDGPRSDDAPYLALSTLSGVLGKTPLPRTNYVGLSWLSRGDSGAEKTVPLGPLLDALRPCGFEIANLQYGPEAKQLVNLSSQKKLSIFEHSTDCTNDLMGLMHLISNAACVLTISNSLAHLSGAMGKPTLLLLPRSRGRHWYWHDADCVESSWYPSITILRQSVDGDWSEPLSQIARILNHGRFLEGSSEPS